jgi:hypothetical protein
MRKLSGLAVPGGVSVSYFVGLLGPVLLTAALGLQLTLTAILIAKPPARQLSDLSNWGVFLFYPEWDIILYLGGITLTLAIAVAVTWAWNRRFRSAGPSASGDLRLRLLVVQAGVAIGGTAIYLINFLKARTELARVSRLVEPIPELGQGIPPSFFAAFGAVTVVSIAAALAGFTHRKGERKESGLERVLEPVTNFAEMRLSFSILDVIFPIGIVAILYVPSWRHVAGRVFMEENFLHWDYFAMGPALAFRHGHALGSEIHSAYGVGWPMVFGALSSWIPLSYGRMIQIGSIYVCIYLTGVYLLLRLLVRGPALAALGAGATILPFFLWLNGLVIWRVPGVTPLRWAFDIWCFIALALYLRSGRRLWAIVAGALVGLAVLFVIDTGIELGAAFAFYWVCTFWLRDHKPRGLMDLASSVGAALGVLLTGLAIASRGTIFSTRFWAGWLEAPLEFGGGFGMLPLAVFPGRVTMICFAVLFFFYLAVVGYSLARLLHKQAQHFEMFNGVLALYGLLVLVKFLGHSDNSIFPRLLTPAVIVLATLAGRASIHARSYVKRAAGVTGWSRLLPKLPYVAAGLAVLFLFAGPRSLLVDPLLEYPGFVSSQISGRQLTGVCLIVDPKDICGLPTHLEDTASKFRGIADRLRSLRLAGKTFAVIDETGSLFYLATDTAPFGRYSRIFTATHTKMLVRQVRDSLERSLPDYILTRRPLEPGTAEYGNWVSFGIGPRQDSHYGDTWEELSTVIEQNYRLDADVAPFEIWTLAQSAPARSSANIDPSQDP